MSDVTLTAADRSTLLLLQETARARQSAAGSLATGLSVRTPTDDPVAFYQADALRNRVSDLTEAKDGLGQTISGYEAALDGVDGLAALGDQLRGLAQSALGGTEAQRAAAADQYDVVRQQLDALIADATYGGRSQLSASDLGASALTGAASGLNGFASDTDVRAALSELDALRDLGRATSSGFGGDVAASQIRERFNAALSNTLEDGAQKLVEADLTAQAARLVSADVRDQLAYEGLSIVQDNARLLAQIV
jgi:flagellin